MPGLHVNSPSACDAVRMSSTRPAEIPRRSGAESSRKLLRVLTSFNEQHHTQTASELAQAADIPLSSAYRFLSVLREEKLVEEAERGAYRLTLRLVGLGRAANVAVGDLITRARPVLEYIAAESGETTLLVRRLAASAVCADRVESVHPVRLQFDPGMPMSLHAGSAGRVLLATLSHAEREAYFAQAGIHRTAQLGDSELDGVAQVGWAESFGEVDAGIWGVSALIIDGSEVVGAIGVAGPLFRLDSDKRAEVIEAVRTGATAVGASLQSITGRQARVSRPIPGDRSPDGAPTRPLDGGEPGP